VQYQVTQPLNGEAATVRGVEVALQNQLRFLPAPLDGIGVYANCTFSDSTAHFPQHSGDSTLPGQSRHVGNLAASYEKRGFSGRASVNFHGSYIDIVGADNTQDRLPGESVFHMYKREGEPGRPHDHSAELLSFTGGADGTDGLDVTSAPLGPDFPDGLLVAMNSSSRNFLLFRWRDIRDRIR
jgi:outer membrane receptor protein involved in Fe transport